MSVRGVIFDLFHTLTGRESEWSDLPATWKILGVDRRAWDRALNAAHWRLTGKVRDPFVILRRLASELDPAISDARVREAVEIRLRRFRDTMRSIPRENVDTLKRLRTAGLRLGLISNADVIEVAGWNDGPLAGLFDVEIFSCEVGLAKPEPAIYHRCLDALELAPEQCCFVGDGGSDELIAAREIGLKTVFVSGVIAELWPERIAHRRETSDHHIEWVPEILGLPGLDHIGDGASAGDLA